jgi:hypothetical protein
MTIFTCTVVVALHGATAAYSPGAPAAGARPVCGDPMMQAPAPPGVEVVLELSKTTFRYGDAPRLKVTVRNGGLLPIPYSHSGQTYDFWVRDENGIVWLWSQGKTFTDQLEQDTLEPGESRSASTRWVSRCTADGTGLQTKLPRPGQYVAQALWVSQAGEEDRAWWSNEVSFRIKR